MLVMKRSLLRASPSRARDPLPKGGGFFVSSARDVSQTALCLLSEREILRDMQPPHFPQRKLTPHLRPGFLIEWTEDETGVRYIGIILTVNYHGIADPLRHHVTVLSPWGDTVFVRQITDVLAVVHHSMFFLRRQR